MHRLSGVVTPANSSYSAPELEYQLKSSKAKAVFTCVSLLDTALEAAEAAGIAPSDVYLLPTPDDSKAQWQTLPTVDDLITEGSTMPGLELLRWTKGQGSRQVAFLCYSSGTSGFPVSGLTSVECFSQCTVSELNAFLSRKPSDLASKCHLQHPTIGYLRICLAP